MDKRAQSETHLQKGISLLGQKQYEEARAEFETALELDRFSEKAWNGLARTFFDTGQYSEAKQHLERVLSITPDDPSVWRRLSQCHAELEEFPRAMFCARKAVELEPENAANLNVLGIAQLRMGDYDGARESMRKTIRLDPRAYWAQYNIACCYGCEGRPNEALAALKKAIGLNPNYREMARTDSDFDSVRQSKGFKALLEE